MTTHNASNVSVSLMRQVIHRRMEIDDSSFWYRMTPDVRGYGQLGVTDWSLYSGHGGMLLALGALARLDDEISILFQRLADEFFEEFTSGPLPADDWSLGAYIGVSGHAYIAGHLAVLDRRFLDPAKVVTAHVLDAVDRMVPSDESFDVMEGSAGAILGICTAIASGTAERAGSQPLLKELLGKLSSAIASDSTGLVGWIARDTGNVLGGMSHGFAGIAHAARVGAFAEPDAAKHIVDVAREGQMRLYDRERNKFLDLRPEDPIIDTDTEAWCHGADGIVLAVLADPNCWGLSGTDLHRVLETVVHGKVAPNYGLCHGLMGRAVTLRRMVDRLEGGLPLEGAGKLVEHARAHLRGTRHEVIAALESGAWSMDLEDPSLMTGLSGVALALAEPSLTARILTLLPATGA